MMLIVDEPEANMKLTRSHMGNTEEELIGKRGWTCRWLSILQCDYIWIYSVLWLHMYSLSWYLNHVITKKNKGVFVNKRGISYTMLDAWDPWGCSDFSSFSLTDIQSVILSKRDQVLPLFKSSLMSIPFGTLCMNNTCGSSSRLWGWDIEHIGFGICKTARATSRFSTIT